MDTRLEAIGILRSELTRLEEAPRQGAEGAPYARLDIHAWAERALHGIRVGDKLLVITWFHLARRDVFECHPRDDPNQPLTGVFATRSPDRPNPLGLHPVTVRSIDGNSLEVGPIEAIDGTPVVDIKPVLGNEF